MSFYKVNHELIYRRMGEINTHRTRHLINYDKAIEQSKKDYCIFKMAECDALLIYYEDIILEDAKRKKEWNDLGLGSK